MICDYNIKITEGNDFVLLFPLKSRTYVSRVPIDEDIDIMSLQDVSVKIGGVEYAYTLDETGIIVPVVGLTKGTYNIEIVADYRGNDIRAAYNNAITMVEFSGQSNAQQYIAGSPIIMPAAFVICALGDAELEQLKQQLREAKAEADAAKEEAEEAKDEFDRKAEQLDDVAQETTAQAAKDAAEDAKTAAEAIVIPTDYAKQGSNNAATNTAILQAIPSVAGLATEANATTNKNEVLAAITANAGIPTLTIPDTTDSQELAPNVLYIFATRTSELTLTLGAAIIGRANEYHFFVICGATAPTVNFPAGITWNGGSAPTIAADKTYEVSILNNVAAFFEV